MMAGFDTPAGVLRQVAAALTAAGFTEASSPIGVNNMPTGRIDNAFSLMPSGESDTGASRSRPDRAGMRLRQSVTLTLAHKANPKSSHDATLAALDATALALRVLWRDDDSLALNGVHVELAGSTSRTMTGGGAYVITTIPLAFTYTFKLDADLGANRG